jgi:hypothetical protein
MAEVVVVLLLALLGLLGGLKAQHAACPPANGLHDSICGNVDGRAGQERVGIAIGPGSSVRLVVRFADRSVSKRLEDEDAESPIVEKALVFVNGLAAIESRLGLAIVVTVHQGASTAFGQIFRLERGALRRIPIPASAGGEFPYEGSVTHFNVIDCARRRSGLIWISGYGLADQSHYLKERTLYRLVEDKLVAVRHESSRPAVSDAGKFREFAEPQPFPHCLVVRNERSH